MASTIANLTVKADGTMDGVFATLKTLVPITVIPNLNRANDRAPDLTVINKRTGFEFGWGWTRIAKSSNKETVSFKLEAKEIGIMYGNLAPAPGGDETKKVILWNDPE